MSTETVREIEAKFQITSDEAVDVLRTIRQLTPAYTLTPAQDKTHLDTYYDTSSFTLLRAGFVLRLRKSGTSIKVTVKSLMSEGEGALHDRLELEHQIQPNGAPPYQESWPDDLRQFVARHIDPKAEFVPIAVLRQNRAKRDILPASSEPAGTRRVLAELSIDAASVLAPAFGDHAEPQQSASDAIAHFSEVELESAVDEEVFPLRDVAEHLAQEYQLESVYTSKLERALVALYSRPAQNLYSPAGIHLDMHMAEACRLIWREQLMRALLCEHGLFAATNVEYVHDLRVAIRRARTAETLLGHYFQRTTIKPYFDTWKQLARLAGAVRDFDIALVNLDSFRDRLPPTQQDGLEEIHGQVCKHRTMAHAKMVKWVNSDEHSQFVCAFSQFCASPGEGVRRRYADMDSTEPIQVRYVLPGIILACLQRVRVYEKLFADPLATGQGRTFPRAAHRLQTVTLHVGVWPAPLGCAWGVPHRRIKDNPGPVR